MEILLKSKYDVDKELYKVYDNEIYRYFVMRVRFVIEYDFAIREDAPVVKVVYDICNDSSSSEGTLHINEEDIDEVFFESKEALVANLLKNASKL